MECAYADVKGVPSDARDGVLRGDVDDTHPVVARVLGDLIGRPHELHVAHVHSACLPYLK